MVELELVENGARVGYVDTDTGEWVYDGDDPFVEGLLDSLLAGGDAADIERNLRDAPLPEERVAVSIQSGERIRFDIEDSIG